MDIYDYCGYLKFETKKTTCVEIRLIFRFERAKASVKNPFLGNFVFLSSQSNFDTLLLQADFLFIINPFFYSKCVRIRCRPAQETILRGHEGRPIKTNRIQFGSTHGNTRRFQSAVLESARTILFFFYCGEAVAPTNGWSYCCCCCCCCREQSEAAQYILLLLLKFTSEWDPEQLGQFSSA